MHSVHKGSLDGERVGQESQSTKRLHAETDDADGVRKVYALRFGGSRLYRSDVTEPWTL